MTVDPTTALAAAIRLNFDLFLRVMFTEINGGTYLHNWHIDAIAHQLELMRTGQNRRLIVTMPPRHLKSIAISTAWVAWMLGQDPSLNFMCVSYGDKLAEKHARDCLKIMRSRLYKLAFPNVRLARTTTGDFETTAGGGRLSTGVEGPITGRGANFIVIDDPMKGADALSEAARIKVKEWLDGSLISRLDDDESGVAAIVLVMQRLHEDDLAGMLIERGGWNELRLSAIATHDEVIPLTRGRFYLRREGCALHPARRSLAYLHDLRAQSWYYFSSQYQQEPIPRQGNFVEREWFQFYDKPPETGVVIQSWDTASQPGLGNDFTVGITARYYKGRFYILDVYRARVAFGAMERAVIELCRRYKVDRLVIEQAGSGIQLIQRLEEELPDGVPYPVKVKPFESKTIRFEAQASRVQAGQLFLPREAPWLAEFIAEVVGFPNKRHDDQADALAQLLANPPWKKPTIVNVGPELADETYSTGLSDEEVMDNYLRAWDV
ncbi:phage terminase large subunit [Tsuneonella rigui]|uniref:phage terminase large subunit n=1 Tax=Tsuneonella rigui TaxID=1708790 RepID=UPI000F7EA0B2|nr:phage terminase large subunit [Tsuneonella rigui]